LKTSFLYKGNLGKGGDSCFADGGLGGWNSNGNEGEFPGGGGGGGTGISI
jgi:hypothetical protein